MSNKYEKIDSYLSLIERYPHIADNSSGGLTVITNRSILYEEQEKLYKEAERKGQPSHWYDLGVLAEDAWVVVLRDLVQFPNGQYAGYIRTINRHSQLEKSGKDVVVVVKKQDKYLLVRHFRHEDRSWHWECPRGFGEKSLSPKENAEKELMEETGLKPILIRQLDNGLDRVSFFLADCEGDLHMDDREEAITDYRWVDKHELKMLIQSCELSDMFSIRAFALIEAAEA